MGNCLHIEKYHVFIDFQKVPNQSFVEIYDKLLKFNFVAIQNNNYPNVENTFIIFCNPKNERINWDEKKNKKKNFFYNLTSFKDDDLKNVQKEYKKWKSSKSKENKYYNIIDDTIYLDLDKSPREFRENVPILQKKQKEKKKDKKEDINIVLYENITENDILVEKFIEKLKSNFSVNIKITKELKGKVIFLNRVEERMDAKENNNRMNLIDKSEIKHFLCFNFSNKESVENCILLKNIWNPELSKMEQEIEWYDTMKKIEKLIEKS